MRRSLARPVRNNELSPHYSEKQNISIHSPAKARPVGAFVSYPLPTVSIQAPAKARPPCTEGASVAINSPETDENPDAVNRRNQSFQSFMTPIGVWIPRRFTPVLDLARVAPVGEAFREPTHQSDSAIHLSQQQRARIRGDVAAVEASHNGAPLDRFKVEQLRATLRPASGNPLGSDRVVVKIQLSQIFGPDAPVTYEKSRLIFPLVGGADDNNTAG